VLFHPVEQQGLPPGTRMDGRHHLRQATGRPYESFVFLLEELTR
jgi:hypothetical protein